jgi:hypothetical protein
MPIVKTKIAAVAWVLASNLLASSTAMDPLYAPRSWNHRPSAYSASWGKRWTRRSRGLGWASARDTVTGTPISMYKRTAYRHDFSDKVMEVDDFKRDGSSRLWQGSSKIKRPGQYSLTTNKLSFQQLRRWALSCRTRYCEEKSSTDL